MIIKRENFVKKFDRYKHWAHKETDNGTLLIGNPYKDKPFWWLIHIFYKVSLEKLNEFTEKQLKIPVRRA